MVNKEAECDFYSVGSMRVSKGSQQEARRKECERKYYGYTDEMKVKSFNLGGREFKVKGYLGFVLHSDKELVDPKSYRGRADLYIIMPMSKGVAREKSDLSLIISYFDWDYEFKNEPSILPQKWDVVSKDKNTGVEVYISWDDVGWGGVTYIMPMGDSRKIIAKCTHSRGQSVPEECIVHREIMPHYMIEYRVNWSDVPDWRAFDQSVLSYIYGMMEQ